MSDPNINEPNMTESDHQSKESPGESSWTPPPYSNEQPLDEEPVPEMSELQTLTGIFFEPSRTFESFRKKPRFLFAALIIVSLAMGYFAIYFQKVGFNNVVTATVENSPQQPSEEQKKQSIAMQTSTIGKALWYGSPVIASVFIFGIGSLIYMAGVMMMGGKISYLQSLSVWVYSTLPPSVISFVLNVLLIFIKPPDPTDYGAVAGGIKGLVKANLGILVSVKTSPALHTFLSGIDVFIFYGLFLAAIGLKIVGKISSGLAWAVVIGLWFFIVAIGVLLASIFGAG